MHCRLGRQNLDLELNCILQCSTMLALLVDLRLIERI
jgi:hypothetical protein